MLSRVSFAPAARATWIGRSSVSRYMARPLHVHSFDRKTISVSDPSFGTNGQPVAFHNVFLRDADAQFVDRSTRQKDFSTGQISSDIAAEHVQVNNNSDILEVKWNDGVASQYPKHFLTRYSSVPQRREYRFLDQSSNWGEPKLSDIYTCSYKDYMEQDAVFADTLQQLHRTGLVFIKDIPRPEDLEEIPVEKIARRVGYIKQSFYGQSWDVISTPEAINVAYTSVYLPLHMDLLYYESPPGVQLLHVVDNTTKGGESVFADSFSAARYVLDKDPIAYDALTRIPLTFHYPHQTHHYYYQRPLIVEDTNSPIDPSTGRPSNLQVVNYSPPFQGPLDALSTQTDISDQDLDAFVRGLKLFEEYIENPANQLELHTPENTCMVFMNRRILHGRREFSAPSGKRFFKGTYLDIDTVYSKLRTVSNKYPDNVN